MRRSARRAVVASALVVGAWLVTSTPAVAHPLGNFTVSHANAITLRPDGVEVTTVVDSAEIPTQQALPDIDGDGDRALSADELAAAAARECPQVAAGLELLVDGDRVDLVTSSSAMETVAGSAGLPTLRLTCGALAEVDLDRRVAVELVDGYRTDRVGWREVTATGEGVRLVESSVPSQSSSDQLRSYPDDQLSSPLDVRSAQLVGEPGEGSGSGPVVPALRGSDPFSRLVSAGDDRLGELVGDRELTPLVGALAVLLAALLGAGHAVLPGHGKTVMAAYLAGRRGRPRDALLVGATVTVTHTAGVLVLGLALTLFTGLAGERVLRIVGVVSGLLIVAIGVALLRGALKERRAPGGAAAGSLHVHEPAVAKGPGGATTTAVLDQPAHGHDHGHGHGHSHGHGHGHSHGREGGFGRRGLVGIGVVGGLVPSPSALIVLLGAIALGRTVFGVLLVLAYGVGMAAVLTAAGLLLVRARGRIDRMLAGGCVGTATSSVLGWLPTATAVLVLLVGLGLVGRGALFP